MISDSVRSQLDKLDGDLDLWVKASNTKSKSIMVFQRNIKVEGGDNPFSAMITCRVRKNEINLASAGQPGIIIQGMDPALLAAYMGKEVTIDPDAKPTFSCKLDFRGPEGLRLELRRIITSKGIDIN